MLFTGVLAAIKRADLVVVVAREISNNVAFELGIACGLSKDLILLAPSETVHAIPTIFSDIAGVKCSIYDPDRISEIPDLLRNQLIALRTERAKRASVALSPDYLIALGDALQIEGLYDEAVAKYKAAIDLDSRNARYLVRLGQAHAQKYDLENAISAFRKAIEIDPYCTIAFDLLGQCLLDGGQYKTAITECYMPLIAKFPQEDNYYFKIAVAYTEMRQPDRAADFLSDVTARGVKSAGLFYDLAWTTVRASRDSTGKTRESWIHRAAEALQKAIEMDPSYRGRAREDEDFETVRALPEFAKLLT